MRAADEHSIESHAFRGETIEVGGVDVAVPVGAEIRIAVVVGKEKQDVGRSLRRGGLEQTTEQYYKGDAGAGDFHAKRGH